MSQVEVYKVLFGYYFELVFVDWIYLIRKNCKVLKDKGICNSGLLLGCWLAMICNEK